MNQITTQTHRRRTPDEWQQLVSEWLQSDQSASQFCTERSIGYASFCQWRKRLSAPEVPEQVAAPGFIDLGVLSSGAPGHWQIVLSLGNGVELKLSQR